MFNATEILVREFIDRLKQGYRRTFGGQNPEFADIIGWVGGMALENISNSDALYHNVEHTIQVTLVGQELLRGKQLKEGGISGEDWLHFIVSLVCHDIGYVKGVCRLDTKDSFATGKGAKMTKLPPGSTDASLTPYHVDRGNMFIDERFGGHPLIKAHVIKANIEWTRFPVPASGDSYETRSFPGLVRAADLIGQLCDPRYLKKVAALFYEFQEVGANKVYGFKNPGDLRRSYPRFFWQNVHPYIRENFPYLELTQQGKQILSNLYANVFLVEHEEVGLFKPETTCAAKK